MSEINLQGLIDEVLKMAKERQAIDTGSDRGSNAWNAREVDKMNNRFNTSEDERKKQELLGKQGMDLQGLKNTGLTDVATIGETGATARQRLADTSRENVAGTLQATDLEGNRSKERMGDKKNTADIEMHRVTGMGAEQLKLDAQNALMKGTGKPGPEAPATGEKKSLTETQSLTPAATPAPTVGAPGPNGATPPTIESAEDYAKRYKMGSSAMGINLGMNSPEKREAGLASDRASADRMAQSDSPDERAKREEQQRLNRKRLRKKDE
jgi:hypothetical protein